MELPDLPPEEETKHPIQRANSSPLERQHATARTALSNSANSVSGARQAASTPTSPLSRVGLMCQWAGCTNTIVGCKRLDHKVLNDRRLSGSSTPPTARRGASSPLRSSETSPQQPQPSSYATLSSSPNLSSNDVAASMPPPDEPTQVTDDNADKVDSSAEGDAQAEWEEKGLQYINSSRFVREVLSEALSAQPHKSCKAARERKGRVFIISVGINVYQQNDTHKADDLRKPSTSDTSEQQSPPSKKKLANLVHCCNDAVRICRALITSFADLEVVHKVHAHRCGDRPNPQNSIESGVLYEDDRIHIQLYLNEHATKRNIEIALSSAIRKLVSSPDDQLIFYFSGHGVSKMSKYNRRKNKSKQSSYLYAYDTDINDLQATGLQLTHLYRLAQQHGFLKIAFLIDACYADDDELQELYKLQPVPLGRLSRSGYPTQVDGESAEILVSSLGHQTAREGHIKGGIMTNALVNILRNSDYESLSMFQLAQATNHAVRLDPIVAGQQLRLRARIKYINAEDNRNKKEKYKEKEKEKETETEEKEKEIEKREKPRGQMVFYTWPKGVL